MKKCRANSSECNDLVWNTLRELGTIRNKNSKSLNIRGIRLESQKGGIHHFIIKSIVIILSPTHSSVSFIRRRRVKKKREWEAVLFAIPH